MPTGRKIRAFGALTAAALAMLTACGGGDSNESGGNPEIGIGYFQGATTGPESLIAANPELAGQVQGTFDAVSGQRRKRGRIQPGHLFQRGSVDQGEQHLVGRAQEVLGLLLDRTDVMRVLSGGVGALHPLRHRVGQHIAGRAA